MSNIALTSANVYGTWISTGAVTLASAVKGNTYYAQSVTGSSASLTCVQLQPAMVLDCTVVDVKVSFNAYTTSSAGTPQLQVNLVGLNRFTGSGLTTLGSALNTSTLSTSPAAYNVGNTSNVITTWGYDLRVFEIDPLNFGVQFTPVGATDCVFFINNLVVTVYYTSHNYIVGSRSSFTVRSNSYPETNDNIPDQSDGFGLEHQIKSYDVNAIGDALYNIEVAMIAKGSPSLPVVGYTGPIYAAVATVTATIPGGLHYGYFVNGGKNRVSIFDSNLNSLVFTAVPVPPSDLRFYFVSGIGWIDSTPVHVTSSSIYLRPNSLGTYDSFINALIVPYRGGWLNSFNTWNNSPAVSSPAWPPPIPVGQTAYSNYANGNVTSSFPGQASYGDALTTLPTGTLTLKLTGISSPAGF